MCFNSVGNMPKQNYKINLDTVWATKDGTPRMWPDKKIEFFGESQKSTEGCGTL